MYSCEICNYFSEARTAIYTHNKSKKHIQKLEDYNNKIKEIDEMKIIQIKNKEINELKKKLIKTENEKKRI